MHEFDPDINVMTIFKSCTPYWVVMLVGMALIIIFPHIATWLPSRLF